MNTEQRSEARLLKEVKELISILKMKIRTDCPKNKVYEQLTLRIDSLAKFEEQAISEINYTKELEEEVFRLRKTCDKFSELSSSVQLLHENYKEEIKSLTNDKNQLANENSQLKSSIQAANAQISVLNKEIGVLKEENKNQKDQWDRDRAIFAQEQIGKKAQEQKLLHALDKLERIKKSKIQEDKSMMEECMNLKRSLEEMQNRVSEQEEFEEIIREKDEQIEALKRKCRLFEKELSLREDEDEF
ncbi:unnamed protein product [Blepharisma stoltei]|uniref:Coiled-coil domain-containing protein 172 n=1 Tax=Blepharisma stoltei TaxID=1481888 RepID=A0AAU9IT78_9CILI|nr:unnamed protein product [Blepharisma stoltei]